MTKAVLANSESGSESVSSLLVERVLGRDLHGLGVLSPMVSELTVPTGSSAFVVVWAGVKTGSDGSVLAAVCGL